MIHIKIFVNYFSPLILSGQVKLSVLVDASCTYVKKWLGSSKAYLRVDSKHRLCDSEQCRKRKEWVLEIKKHAEDVTVTLFKNLDIHTYETVEFVQTVA